MPLPPPPITRPTYELFNERGIRDGSSFVEDFNGGNPGGKRRMWTKWEDRHKLAQAVLGYSQISRDGDGVPICLQRLPPLPHPDTENLPGFYARSISDMRGHKVNGKVTDSAEAGSGISATFDKADFTIGYEAVPYPILKDSEISLGEEHRRMFFLDSVEPGCEVLQLPAGTMRFKSGAGIADVDNKVLPVGKTVLVPTMTLRWLWVDLPEDILKLGDPLSNRINGTTDGEQRSYLGTVNSVPFPGPDGYPAWSLLLTEARPIRKISPLGKVQFDLALTTAFRPTPYGWNGLFFSDTNTANGDQSGWYYVGHGESPTFYTPGTLLDDKALYDERDLHDILNVAPPPAPPPPP